MKPYVSRFTFYAARFPPDLITALLLACALMLFLPSLGGYFLSDDFVLLTWTRVASISEVAEFFDPNTFWFYRPMVKVVYWLGQSIFGLRAAPFHLLSLALHGLNAYFVYRLVARQGGVRWVTGLAAALLFLFNAHHAETVSWIAAIGDLMAACCMLSALILFQRYLERHFARPLAASVGLFALGLLSRETAVMLPALLLLSLLVIPSGGKPTAPLSRLAVASAAYGAVLLGYLAVQLLGRTGTQPGLGRGGLQFRALNLDSILLAIMDYVHGLVPGGTLLAELPLDALRVLVWFEWLAILAVAVVLWRVGYQLALFGLLWMLLTPLLFIFFTGPSGRYFYLPSIGYAIFVAALVTSLLAWVQKRLPDLNTPARVTAGILLAALLLFQVVDLLARENAWRVAGQATGGVFHDIRQYVPEPRDYSAFYFVDLPMFLNGVPTFQNAVQEGVQLIYDNQTITASVVTCDYLRQQTELPRYSFFFRFKGDGVQQLPSVSECR
ncbi:MAG TPA: glycosyltransferase family 39 protein [Chloroflexia bacterium]|nr:glycosyltransferase family 39 protein [Chloroflexia bacterium]